jgi:Tol biopolymer transport system component
LLFVIFIGTVLLSACGGKATSKPQLPAANVSPTASATDTAAPSPIEAPSATAAPTAVVTLPPAAPLPGLVYTGAAYTGLWIVQADGQSQQLSAKVNPVLSPDQTQVLYSDNGDIWLDDLPKGKIINLTHSNDKAETNYQWWPAHPGVIVFDYQPKKDIQPMAGYLATAKTDGTNYIAIDDQVGSISPPALSPDGQSIAYDQAGQPWVFNYRGGNVPIMPRSFQEKYRNAADPAWSPDGRKLAWQLFGDQAGTDGWSAVAVLNLDTLQVTLLHRYTVLGGSDIGAYHLAWSPDGAWLAVVDQAEFTADGKVSLWVMRPDGSEEHHFGSGDRPIWSPDSSMLAYLSGTAVFAVKASDWNPFPITLPGGSVVLEWVKQV